jgi:hypothetical protein
MDPRQEKEEQLQSPSLAVTYLISVTGFFKPEYIPKAPLLCRNNCMTLTIKCRELLTKAKTLRYKLTLTIYET